MAYCARMGTCCYHPPWAGAQALMRDLSRFRFVAAISRPSPVSGLSILFADCDAFRVRLRVCLPGGIAPKEDRNAIQTLRSMICSEGSCVIATFRGAARATRISSGFPRSCCSRRRCRARRACRRARSLPHCPALAQPAPSDVLTRGRGWAINAAPWRFTGLHSARGGLDGEFPRETHDLVALPGIGPATAQGIRSFAFDLPGVYLETNVRTVFLHHFFPLMCRPFPIASWCR